MDRRSDHELWEQEGEDAARGFMEARRQVNEMLEPAANLSAGETPKGTLITKEWADEFEKRLAIEDAARKRLERWLREPAR